MSHRACRRSPPAAGPRAALLWTKPRTGRNLGNDRVQPETDNDLPAAGDRRPELARFSRDEQHAPILARSLLHSVPPACRRRFAMFRTASCLVAVSLLLSFVAPAVAADDGQRARRRDGGGGRGAAPRSAPAPPAPRRRAARPPAATAPPPPPPPTPRRPAVRRRRGPRRKDAARGPCRAARRKPQPHDRRRDPRDPHPARPPDRRTGRNRRPEERERYHGARRKPRPHARRRGRRAHLPDARSRRPEEPERCRGARRKPQPAAPGGRAASSGIARTRGGGNPYRSAGAGAAGGRR